MNDTKRRVSHPHPSPAHATRAALGPGAVLGIGDWQVRVASLPATQGNPDTPWPSGLYARRLVRAR